MAYFVLVPYDYSDRYLARMWTALFHSADQEGVESFLPPGLYCHSNDGLKFSYRVSHTIQSSAGKPRIDILQTQYVCAHTRL